MSSASNPLLHLLVQQLQAAKVRDEHMFARNIQGTTIHVPGAGKIISSAYEQLRNAAEYTEEHLLLQRAIRRFFRRNLSFFIEREVGNVGEELVVELTQAGYLRNGTISQETAHAVLQAAKHHMRSYWELRHANVSRDEAMEWALALMSVDSEEILNPHSHHTAVVQFGYQHYLQLFPRDALITSHDEQAQYEISLYIAVHVALLKSDIAVVRHDLIRMYNVSAHDQVNFIQFNRTVTQLFTSKFTQRLKRAVDKHGAPVRILKSMIEDGADVQTILHDKDQFLATYTRQVQKEYRAVGKRLNKGLIKSIIFIFITKVIIGVGIEVPYDLIFHGSIALLPLAINLFFPPAYMASLKLGLKVPSGANAEALRAYIEKALFTTEQPIRPSLRSSTHNLSFFAKLMYGVLFFVPFAIIVYILWLLHFNAAQAIIFMVFMSTASFLGFRLSHMVRELEIGHKQTGFLASMRDFFYLPFILLGQWLSSKYAKVNAVAYVLDIAIELPLKTVLRLFRQWTSFLSDKHDEIY